VQVEEPVVPAEPGGDAAEWGGVTEDQWNTVQSTLEQMSGKLEALSPVKILDRGYALVFDASGALVKDAAQLRPGQEISARVSLGSFLAEVKKTTRE